MGIPNEVFYLYRLKSTFCKHDLLVRVNQPGYSNADVGAEEAALGFADTMADALRAWYQKYELARTCKSNHEVEFTGQGSPDPEVDDDSTDEEWGVLLDHKGLQEVEVNLGILGIGDKKKHKVFLLTDETGQMHLNYPNG